MTKPESQIEIVNPASIRQKPELFDDDGVAFDVWLPLAVNNPINYQDAESANGLVPVLDELLIASEIGGSDWKRWKTAGQGDDIINKYSPFFEIPITKDVIPYRLNVRHPFRDFEQALIDLEVRALDPYEPTEFVTYVGQQASWTPGSIEPVRMHLKNYPDKGKFEQITPNNSLSTYWNRFVKAAVAAHAQLVLAPTIEQNS